MLQLESLDRFPSRISREMRLYNSKQMRALYAGKCKTWSKLGKNAETQRTKGLVLLVIRLQEAHALSYRGHAWFLGHPNDDMQAVKRNMSARCKAKEKGRIVHT